MPTTASDNRSAQNNLRMMRENPLANALHQVFLNSPHYARLLARTARQSKTELNLAGLTDSAKSLVLSVLQHEIRRPFYIVVQDNHTGARLHQELSNLSKYPVLLYPASEVSPYEQVLSSPDNVAAQLEVLGRARSQHPEPYTVIVTARALMQRVLPPDILEKNTITLKTGETHDTNELAKKLTRLGYTRESLVTLRGEFSIRGDIIDVYPSSGLPFRLELFGDEIESIRVFNIDNQRSIEGQEFVTIPPRWWIILEDEGNQREELVARLTAMTEETVRTLSDQAATTLRSVMENDLQALAAGAYPESVEYYSPYVHEAFSTLLDYLPAEAVVTFDEWDSIQQTLASYEEKLKKALDEGLDTGRLLPLPRKLHLDSDQVLAGTAANQRVFLSSLPVFDVENKEAVIEFKCRPIERFANQMNLLVDKIREWRKDGNRIV
ncbi:MAG: hypothetical protein K2Z81_14815, partial [Cyanobacteria bacterium]|nr:hypothetical protein [Cyanobacteriota bacterium]